MEAYCTYRSRRTSTRGGPYTNRQTWERAPRNTASLSISPWGGGCGIPFSAGHRPAAASQGRGGGAKMLDDDGDFATIRSLPLAALVATLAALTAQAAGFASL